MRRGAGTQGYRAHIDTTPEGVGGMGRATDIHVEIDRAGQDTIAAASLDAQGGGAAAAGACTAQLRHRSWRT